MADPWTKTNLVEVEDRARQRLRRALGGPRRFGAHHEADGEPVDDDWVK